MKKQLVILLTLLLVGVLGTALGGCNGDQAPAEEVYEEEQDN